MPRRLFKRYMPDPTLVREHKSLRFLGALLHDPNLWHLNRHSVSRAMAVGLFAAFVPMPMQMLLAASLAIPIRANLPISVGLVWLTNPVTMPPIFYCTYKLGALLMGIPPVELPEELTWDWITGELATHWQPFLLGSLLSGTVLAASAYGLTMAYWRWWVAHNWRKRAERRRQATD
ncbi:DUF2062 domain-containing protein [Aquipseudomonas alcaligenes]|uniref:DUF2062 domain-containing protein n=1 Tax=Aquipseudomonas alcaligenes TaxID=43263 RepID=A0A2V4KSI7_AQUAC|nr:DUF2062 domain-containing protein [Pseudomonas alcaligenes]PYC24645.1 DUF2062 domain-containing protein [Pseudomonas alcaligenes]